MSSIVDAVLFAALVLTTASVVLMYRKLKRLDAYHEDYRRIFADTERAMNAARDAVNALNGEGREMVAELGRGIEEARRLITEIDARRDGAPPAPTAADDVATRPGLARR